MKRNTARIPVWLATGCLLAASAVRPSEALSVHETEGVVRDAARLLDRILQGADALKDADERSGIQIAVAGIQARIGDFAGAMKTVGNIPEKQENTSSPKVPALDAIARAQLEAGNYSGAIRTSAMLANLGGAGESRLKLVCDIAKAQARKGLLADACRTVETVPTPVAKEIDEVTSTGNTPGWGYVPEEFIAYSKVEVLGLIAGGYAKAGDSEGAARVLEQADRIAELPKDKGLQKWMREHILSSRAKGGDIAGALQAAEKLQDGASRSAAYAAIARIQAEGGDIVGTQRTAEKVKGDINRLSVLMAIAGAQARANDREGAIKSIRQALGYLPALRKSGDDDFHFLMAIVTEQFMLGDLDGAIRSSKLYDPSEPRIAQNLQSMGAMAAVTGLVDQGRAAAAEKLYADVGARLNGESPVLLATIALGYAREGDSAAAAKVVARLTPALSAIKDKEALGMVIPDLAEALAETGDFSGALRRLKTILGTDENGVARPKRVFRNVARVQGRRGDEQGALKWIDPLPSPEQRLWALVGLAEGLLKLPGPEKVR